MQWSQVTDKMESMLATDPQRATLALRSIESVEAGLRFLAQHGHQFELAERGATAELRSELESNRRTLSIAEAVQHVQPSPVESGGSEVFDA